MIKKGSNHAISTPYAKYVGKREGGVGVSKAEHCIHQPVECNSVVQLSVIMRQVAVLSFVASCRFSIAVPWPRVRRKCQNYTKEEKSKCIGIKENELQIDINIFFSFGNLSIDIIKHILQYRAILNILIILIFIILFYIYNINISVCVCMCMCINILFLLVFSKINFPSMHPSIYTTIVLI